MALLESAIGLVVATLVVVYALSVSFWLLETAVLAPRAMRGDDLAWGLEDVQIRISTIDNEAIVQSTVDHLPDGLTDVRVIAEAPIEIDGATVHVVPEAFSCSATHKGRALEWARRNVPCDREYILFLDEDTIVPSLTGLPDADVVQFTELPMYTGSILTYLCEVFRIGYQYEQRSFARFRFPLYVWGGGLAIRRSLQAEVTWDRRSITEDTAFVWSAASRIEDLTTRVVDAKFRNQAPASVAGMIRQRRRWMSGTRADARLLPLRYRVLVGTRAVVWALSPVIVLVAAVATLVPAPVFLGEYQELMVLSLFLFLHYVTVVGASVYGFGFTSLFVAVVLTVPTVLLNTIGALWGFVFPTRQFFVTEKVHTMDIEVLTPGLERGDLSSEDASFGETDAPLRLRNLLRRD